MAIEEEGVYEVEAIMDDRVKGGRKEYLIKWLGYPQSSNTWEYEENVYCDELKKAYEAGKKQQKDPKREPKKKAKISKRITNEWAEVVKRVVEIIRTPANVLEIVYETFDGKKCVCPVEEMHIKAPLALIAFYEENLSFPDE